MGSIHTYFDESKGQKDLNLTEEAIEDCNMKFMPQEVEQFSRLG